MEIHIWRARVRTLRVLLSQPSPAVLWMKRGQPSETLKYLAIDTTAITIISHFYPKIDCHMKPSNHVKIPAQKIQPWDGTSLVTAWLRPVQIPEKHLEYKIISKLQLGKNTKYNMTLNTSEENIHNRKIHRGPHTKTENEAITLPCKNRSSQTSNVGWFKYFFLITNISTWFFNSIPLEKSSHSVVIAFNIYDVKEPLQVIPQNILTWECLIF